MKNQLLTIFREQLESPEIQIDCIYKQHPAWSSLKALVIISEIERCMNVLISAQELRNCDSLKALYYVIKQLETSV